MSIASELNKLVQIFKNWTPTPTPTPDPYVLPAATAETLGGVKVGEGLEVAEDGTLSATGGGGDEYSPVKITIATDQDGTTITSTMEAPDFYAMLKDAPEKFGLVIIRDVSTVDGVEHDIVQHPAYMTINSTEEIPYLGFAYGEGDELRCSATEFYIAAD